MVLQAGRIACLTRICIRQPLRISLRNFWHEDLGCALWRAGERVAFACAGTNATAGTAAFTDHPGDALQSGAGDDSAGFVVDLFRCAGGCLLDDDPARGRGFERLHGHGGCAVA